MIAARTSGADLGDADLRSADLRGAHVFRPPVIGWTLRDGVLAREVP